MQPYRETLLKCILLQKRKKSNETKQNIIYKYKYPNEIKNICKCFINHNSNLEYRPIKLSPRNNPQQFSIRFGPKPIPVSLGKKQTSKPRNAITVPKHGIPGKKKKREKEKEFHRNNFWENPATNGQEGGRALELSLLS